MKNGHRWSHQCKLITLFDSHSIKYSKSTYFNIDLYGRMFKFSYEDIPYFSFDPKRKHHLLEELKT